MSLYPLKFNPIFKEMIWGGNKLIISEKEKGKLIGENYTVSGLKSDVSVVSNGALAGQSLVDLINEFKGELIGKSIYDRFGHDFPLLIKFIDANDDLSVQVHPNDEQARHKHDSFGKTEMWYIIDNETNASLISGLAKKTTPSEFANMHADGKLMDLMNFQGTNAGDSFFIPAGKIHSIGKGNLIAEIQQTSNITYRIYDFERVDKDGNSRELHHKDAMEVIDFMDNESGKVSYKDKINETINLAKCQYFTTNKLNVNKAINRNYSCIDSFVILINVATDCRVEFDGQEYVLNALEALLIPACLNEITIKGDNIQLLETYVE